jgi:hypothetical protein
LDESVRQALAVAGEQLADAVRQGLSAHRLRADLHMVQDADRVRVVSSSRDVHAAETGRAGQPPSAPMESVARRVAPQIVCALAAHLRAGKR